MELFVIFLIIFIIYGAGWIWQTVSEIVRDVNRNNWDNRVYGQVATTRSIKKRLGGHDLDALKRTYQQFAEEVGGQLHDRQMFESPRVSFVHRTGRALLSIYESSDEAPQFYTQLTCTIGTGWTMRLEVFPQRFKDMDVKYLNVDDLQIGDPEFDPRYVVKSNEPEAVRGFLNERVRKAIDELRHLGGNDKILISVNSSRLMIRKQSILSDFETLRRFHQGAGVIYDRILEAWQKAAGIEIMDDAAGPATEAPVCQVCGAAIPREAAVFCRRCKTPHHADCWDYNSGCSTYACGEKRFSNKY